jgi:glutamate/tyrosine decarboxylase-like PLP-dependent enzyme
VPDPISDHANLDAALDLAAREAKAYLAAIDQDLVRPRVGGGMAATGLPEEGVGALAALAELVGAAVEDSTRSAGPRFFHFVMGGGTPAALGADWLTSALDQNAYNWISSPFAARLEQISVDWLKDLFGLPAAWTGVITTGATMANFAGLAAARRWWGLEQGVDVEAEGLNGLPPMKILTSGYVHVSALKAVAMLGLGRQRVRTLSRDAAGRIDLEALASVLREHDREPVVIIANAGDVNTGDFDPIADIVALARNHRAWVHVDGAFGLFAAVSPTTRHLVAGVELADSVGVDGHKWLNVPYDSGYAFVRDPVYLAGAFGVSASYLGAEALARPVFGNLGPEMSRRARSLAVWATLRAYGREGYRAMIERHLRLAERVAEQVDAAPDLERLADVSLNVICFRYRPPGIPDDQLDDLNRILGELVLEDGRVYFGTTVYAGKVAFRPAIVNWRTREEDTDLIVATVRELGARAVAQVESSPARAAAPELAKSEPVETAGSGEVAKPQR